MAHWQKTVCFPYKMEDDMEIQEREFEKLEAIREKYYELIMAVENKYPNEARHQTALRLIGEAQRHDNQTKAAGGAAKEG